MRKYLRGNSGMRFLAILTAVALTLGSVDVTALASAAGQNAAEQTAVDPTVLRPGGDGRWSSDNGNLLWFGKEKDGTPMQYRILSSTNVFSTDA